MTEVAIRSARPEDWPEVVTVLVEMGRDVASGAADDPTYGVRFAGHVRRLDTVTLVAGADGRIVGVLDMWYQQRLGDHRPQAYVQELAVREAARGSGVGGRLLERAEELARKRGCFRMWLVTARWRGQTHAFYGDQGWDDYGKWFVKPLTE